MNERDIAADIAEGMKEVPRIRACKHNWVEDNFAQKWRSGKFYVYRCTRCNAASFAELTEERTTMSKQTEALKLALEALEESRNALAWFYDSYPQDVTEKGNELLPHVETVLTAIREALAEQPAQQQEPVAWRTFDGEGGYDYRTYDMNENYAKEWDKQNPKHKGWVEPLYTSPQPNKPWAGLSTDEIYGMYNEPRSDAEMVEFARAIEAKLREKNT